MPCRWETVMPLRSYAIVACLLTLAGCSRHAPVAAASPAAPPPGTRYGTIAAVRPAGFAMPVAAGDPVRGSILRALAPAAGGAPLIGSGAATDYIVREDGGETVSVVQGDGDGLRPGVRVAVTSAPTRLARLLAAAQPGG